MVYKICIIQDILIIFYFRKKGGREEEGERERKEKRKERNSVSFSRKLIKIASKITKVRNTTIICRVKSTYLLIFPK